MHIITFLKENWLNLALVVVGASAIIVYLLQKRSEERSAATKVILQIDQIEKNIAALKAKRSLDNISVYKTPAILEHSSWEECGYQFYKSMGRDDIRLIDDFFACAAELEKSRFAICNSLEIAWKHKDAELQARIAEILLRKENNGYNDDINTFISLFNPRPDIFTANLPIDILIENLNKFQVLSGTTAYKSLQNISYRK